MEDLMRAIIRSFLVLSLTLIFGASISNAQVAGLRVEADIPFDFTIGSNSFSAGKYNLSAIRNNGSVYYVTMRDEAGKLVCSTTAIRNGSTMRNKSEMMFAVVDDQRALEKIRTPDFGLLFTRSSGDKRVAKAKRESVPLSGATPN